MLKQYAYLDIGFAAGLTAFGLGLLFCAILEWRAEVHTKSLLQSSTTTAMNPVGHAELREDHNGFCLLRS